MPEDTTDIDPNDPSLYKDTTADALKSVRGRAEEEKAPRDKREADLANPEKGKLLLDEVRRRVFEEYDRALLEETSEKGEVEQNKKHVVQVVELTDRLANIVSGQDPEFEVTDPVLIDLSAKNTALLEAELHDVEKLVPERERISFDAQISILRNEKHQLQEKIEEMAESSAVDSLMAARLEDIDQEISWYEQEQRKNLDNSGGLARLLMHGEDSADFSSRMLTEMGFSPEFCDSIEKDIVAHMGMPFVEGALGVQQKRYNTDASFRAPFPERLEEDGTFPKPRTKEGALLFAADLLSPGKLAGDDLEKDPIAGCFDRYVMINLRNGAAKNLTESVNSARKSVEANVDRLCNPPDSESRPEAAKVERIAGETIGRAARAEILGFVDFVENNVVVISPEGKPIKGFGALTVYKNIVDGDVPETVVDSDASMLNYYLAVKAYRESKLQGVTSRTDTETKKSD